MHKYNFEEQSKLLEIAVQILEDYNIKEWSFGGGTALSTAYYNHRMSYDIDIFSEDFSAIEKIRENYKEIASNLSISHKDVEVSPSGVTFLLSNETHGLKIDFLYGKSLTSASYISQDILGQKNIKIQTATEIISRKLKYRENITIRDFVDFAYVEKEDHILTSIKQTGIIEIERYLDIINQFNEFNEEDFNQELVYLDADFIDSKICIGKLLQNFFTPNDIVKIAVDENSEIIAFDEWVTLYKEDFESVGVYNIYNVSLEDISSTLNKNIEDVSYLNIYNINENKVVQICNNKNATL